MQTATTSPSPTKRAAFRSKTKLKQTGTTIQETRQKRILPSFYVYLKQFPLDTAEDVMAIVRAFQVIHTDFLQNLENLKLYKNHLGCLFEQNWFDFMAFLKNVVGRMNKRADRIIDQKQKKIAQLLKINKALENQQQNWKQKNEKLQNLRDLQSAQLTIADTELEIVNKEMNDIYKILQSDMSKISTYLTALEERRAAEDEVGSNQIYASLKTMNTLLNSMESQQNNAGTNLSTMRQLIKAMTKCTKATTGTQVDESELQTKAGSIFSKGTNDLPFEQGEGISVNIYNKQDSPHLIDRLKEKEKEQPHENFKMQKHAQKPWALTPTLLVFLQNMSKQNQAGKVLPWQYMKEMITQIYDQRMKYDAQMTAGTVGNCMLFDQFVVFYFIHKHRIRRLAEVKLLEFIISLKYYCKFWIRAQTFCNMMDVMRYNPLFDAADSFNYRFDYNTQNFFFAIYRKLIGLPVVNEEGTTYVPIKMVKKLMKVSLFFTDQMNKSRLLAKIDKDARVFEKVEHCDIDYALLLFIDEYLAVKKRNCNTLVRAFSKKFDQIQGYFTVDELVDLFTDLSHIYRAGSDFSQKYPIDSKLQTGKLYLYAVTSAKNGYDINVNSFLQSCQRFGFDAPFPFLHACARRKKEEHEGVNHIQRKIPTSQIQKKVEAVGLAVQQISNQIQVSQPVNLANLNAQRIDVTMKLFSQHFSLLREMKSYVDIFTRSMKQEKNPEILWKSFQQINIILQRGCQFLKYPLLAKRK